MGLAFFRLQEKDSTASLIKEVDKKQCLINQLPVEILIRIFFECPSAIRDVLNLSHVCRHWALITLDLSSLWTDIRIQAIHSQGSIWFHKFCELVRMQAGRARGQLLDITWKYDTAGDYKNDVFISTHQYAPCEQWRSLKLTVEGEPVYNELAFARYQSFPNLNALTIVFAHIPSVIHAIQRTNSRKLQTLDLRHFRLSTGIYKSYAGILKQVSDLYLPRISLTTDQPLPPNITTLRAQERSQHLFPYVQTYKTHLCFFKTPDTIDLQRLTTLTIFILLEISAGCHVLLPSLRHLTHKGVNLSQDAKLEAPLLESLHLSGSPSQPDHDSTPEVDALQSAISHPGYALFSSTSLTVGVCLPTDSSLQLLSQCPAVEEVTLSFKEQLVALHTVDYIVNGRSFALGYWTKALVEDVCLRLKVLRLRFAWPRSAVGTWKERTVDSFGVKKRGLEVFALWKGEESYVRLA